MNSFIKYIPESLNDNKAFVEHMLSIIDTKLQFTKYHTNALILAYSNTSILVSDVDDPMLENFTLDPGNKPDETEAVFTLIEKYSKTTNLLLLIRSKLTQKNVSLIYDLLCNDIFLDYDNDALDQLLEKSMC